MAKLVQIAKQAISQFEDVHPEKISQQLVG